MNRKANVLYPFFQLIPLAGRTELKQNKISIQALSIPPSYFTTMSKRTGKRKSRFRMTRSPKIGNSVTIERELIATISKGVADTGLYRSFTLNQFSDSDIISMFQEYRIKKLTLTWMLVNAPNNNADFPTLYTAPQHYFASGIPPASRDEVIQFRNTQHHQFGPANVVFKKTYIPFVALDAATTGKKFTKSPWLSTTTDVVSHYTSVEWISRYNSTSSPTHTLELVAHATIQARHTR